MVTLIGETCNKLSSIEKELRTNGLTIVQTFRRLFKAIENRKNQAMFVAKYLSWRYVFFSLSQAGSGTLVIGHATSS